MSGRCLLVCGAHPDDETFVAGTMAKYASEGVRVAVLCGTRGERGATADLCSIKELPQVREQELRASMRTLGLAEADVRFLPYEDQKLSEAPFEDARPAIVALVREIRPQVVVSFDLQGANGHPDHVAMSRLTSDALAAAADQRWYADASPAFQVRRLLWMPPLRPWLVDPALDWSRQPGVDFLIDTSRWAEVKALAIREHKTQLPGIQTLFLKQNSPELTLNREAFRQAWGPEIENRPGNDLFAGIA